MSAADRIREANSIQDKRALRLLTIEAACSTFAEHGNEHQAALFLWIANEARAARMALRELNNLVHDATQKAQAEPKNPSA